MKAGDHILMDRGFLIDDLLAEKGAVGIRPPFLENKPHLDLHDENRGKLIAKARVHIERFNQRFKLFKYVGEKVPQQKFHLISQALYVCCHLANLTPLLVKK